MRRKKRNSFARAGILCLALVLGLGALGVGYAHWTETLTIGGTVETGEWEVGGSGGTQGYWHNWDAHYQPQVVSDWLVLIDGSSQWLVTDMDSDGDKDAYDWDLIRAAGVGGGATPGSRFLMHYTATRLNLASGRLFPGTTHDVTGISGYGYLDYLAIPTSATLTDIIIAIELKEGTSPTDAQFEIMKDICDALNNLNI